MALKPYRATSHWKKIRLKVLARDAYTCAYCGSPDANEVDHVWPKSRGGEDTLDNLVCCCRRCGKCGNECSYSSDDAMDTVESIGI